MNLFMTVTIDFRLLKKNSGLPSDVYSIFHLGSLNFMFIKELN